jgi:L-malate glycosyltransferase
MRIAFVSLMYDAPWGGSEVLWAQTAARALREGHEVLVSTYNWPEPARPLQELLAAGATGHFRRRYEPTLRFRALDWVTRLPRRGRLPEIDALARFNPEVVVISQGGWNDLLFHQQLYQWVRQRPFLVICHNYHDPVRQNEHQRRRMIELFGQAREVLMISRLQQQVLRRQLAAPLANSRVVQNPLNLPATYPVPYPALPEGGPVQLAVMGSLDVDRKGQDVLLEVLSAPHWVARNWHLNFYGQGPDREYLERLIVFVGLQGRVTLHGHVADSAQAWRNTHLLVVPSRIESGPMVVQEAALCGRPIVAADVGLVRDWVEEGQTGFIADTASRYALDVALERAWNRQAQWSVMAEKAGQRARQQPLLDAAADLLSHLITASSR